MNSNLPEKQFASYAAAAAAASTNTICRSLKFSEKATKIESKLAIANIVGDNLEVEQEATSLLEEQFTEETNNLSIEHGTQTGEVSNKKHYKYQNFILNLNLFC